MSVANYYAWLGRFQDFAHRLGHDTGQRAFTVHRLLTSPTGETSGHVLHLRVADALSRSGVSLRDPVVLDAGCGLGGTTFFLQSAVGGHYVGVTLSPAQCDRANREAARRGIADRCRFLVRDYDDDLSDVLPHGADLVIAIESLAHSSAPSASIVRLARALRPNGRLVVVDDMPVEDLAATDVDLAAFRAGWRCPVVAKASDVEHAVVSVGLVVAANEDLTPLVPQRRPQLLEGLLRVNRFVRAILKRTPARVLLDSLHGGLMLERLYRRGVMRYRLIVAARPPQPVR